MIAIPVGLLLGAGGAAVVYAMFEPAYEARSIIRVDQSPQGILTNTTPGDNYASYQKEILISPLVIGPALGDPSIAGLPEIQAIEQRQDVVSGLAKEISVESRKDSEFINVRFAGPDPENAAKIVNAVVNSYMQLRKEHELKRSQRTIELLRDEANSLAIEISRLREIVRELTKQATGVDPFAANPGASAVVQANPYGDLQGLITRNSVDQAVLRAQHQALKESYDSEPVDVPQSEVERVVEQHAEMQQLKASLAEIHSRISDIQTRTARPKSDPLMAQMEADKKRTEASIEELRQRLIPMIREDMERSESLRREEQLARMDRELKSLKLSETILNDRYNSQVQQLRKGSGETLELEFKRDELARAQDIYDKILFKIRTLEPEQRIERVELMLPATPPRAPVEMLPLKKMAMGAGVGLVIPFLLAGLWEFTQRRVSNSQQLQKESDLLVIGEIASLPTRSSISSSRALRRKTRLFEESVESLRTSLVLSAQYDNLHVIAVTSAVAREGKTSISSQLALSLARSTGKPTLLIDGDMRSPDLHAVFDTELEPGLAQVLREEASYMDAIVPTSHPNLYLLPAGRLSKNPSELLGESGEFRSLMSSVRTRYHYVVSDTPPVLAASEAAILSKAADASLLCVMRDVSRLDQVCSAWSKLDSAGAHPVGTVMNNVSLSRYAYTYGDYPYEIE